MDRDEPELELASFDARGAFKDEGQIDLALRVVQRL